MCNEIPLSILAAVSVSLTLPQLQRDCQETSGTKEISVQVIKAFSMGPTHHVPFLNISLTAPIKTSHISPILSLFLSQSHVRVFREQEEEGKGLFSAGSLGIRCLLSGSSGRYDLAPVVF